MLPTKSDAVDSWNEYQPEKLKHHMAELGLNQLQALQLLARLRDARAALRRLFI